MSQQPKLFDADQVPCECPTAQGEAKASKYRAFPKVNTKLVWTRYFVQVTKALNKHFDTCIRSYGLFIRGDPSDILSYITECYRIYDEALDAWLDERRKDPEWAEWRTKVDFEGGWMEDFEQRNRRSFWYFVNTDPSQPGLIYYGQRRSLRELKEGDIVGFTVPSTSTVIGHAG